MSGYTSDSIWMTEDEARDYYNRRLFLDMVNVLERMTHTKVGEVAGPYTTAPDRELELADEVSRLTLQITRLQAQQEDRSALLASLFKPPAPWHTFGHYANHEPIPDITFWGDDGTGLPIWERETITLNVDALAAVIAERRRIQRRTYLEYKGKAPLEQDIEAARAVISYLEGGMNDG